MPPQEVVRRNGLRVPAHHRLVDEDVDFVLVARPATRSALQAAMPERTGGIGLNHASRATAAF